VVRLRGQIICSMRFGKVRVRWYLGGETRAKIWQIWSKHLSMRIRNDVLTQQLASAFAQSIRLPRDRARLTHVIRMPLSMSMMQRPGLKG
jgi:hypothetical protein